MNNKNKRFGQGLVLALMALMVASWSARAVDLIITDGAASKHDQRGTYANALLHAVMERTRAEFGPYRIEQTTQSMQRKRLHSEMREGKLLNVTTFPATAEWLNTLQAVPIPIDLGLLSWRLLLIDQKNQDKLRALAQTGQLKKATAGAGRNWIFLEQLRQHGYRTTTGNDYEGLFQMLRAGRFDYLPRGVNEIFPELDARSASYPGLAVDDSALMHSPIAPLFFIAPKETRLHRRISTGMQAMLRDGTLEQLMLDFYRRDLERAKLCDRILVELPDNAVPSAILTRKELWFNPFEPRHSLCASGSPTRQK